MLTLTKKTIENANVAHIKTLAASTLDTTEVNHIKLGVELSDPWDDRHKYVGWFKD